MNLDWVGCERHPDQVHPMIRLLATILLISLYSFAAYGADDDLPAPPEGFQWYDTKNGVGAFLRPDGWFVKEEVRGGAKALFISREDIDSAGRFVVGLTVNEITRMSARGTAKPSAFARNYASQLAQKMEVLDSGVVEGNTSDMHVVRVKGDNGGVATIAHHIAIGNDSLDSAYIIIFEAPASEWDAAIEKGRPMLNTFFLGE
jgi:hypothetical protein